MTKRWEVQFDGPWLMTSATTRALTKARYMVGREPLGSGIVGNYTLHRIEGQVGVDAKFPVIFETRDLGELNRYVNLILGPRPEREE